MNGQTLKKMRAEHREFAHGVESLRRAASLVGHASLEESQTAIDESLTFLRDRLVPHAIEEDATVYPLVAQLLGSPRATATMSRDHAEIVLLAEQLAELADTLHEPDETTLDDARALLFGLHAILRLHLAKEDEIYFPLLEAAWSARQAPLKAHVFTFFRHHAS